MTITRVVAVAVLCLSSLGVIAAQSAKEKASAEQQIRSLTMQMYDAEKRKDLKFIFAHMAEDFAEAGGDGKIYRRSDIEAAWNDVVLQEYKLSDCMFKLMTTNSAYMSCLMEVDGTFKGQAFPKHIRVSWVWAQQNGKWLVQFEQGTVVPEPATSK